MKKLLLSAVAGLSLIGGPVAAVEAAPPAPTAVAPEAVRPSYRHWYYNVERWHSTAISAGWSESQWYHLSCIIYRESRGVPTAYNGRDPYGGSRGLTQINGIHVGWLTRAGIIRYANDLFNAYRNLRAAKALYNRAGGWSPWGRCG